MAASTRVHFSRINRRPVEGEVYERRPLADDIQILIDARNTAAEEHGRQWVVTDLQLDPSGDFATGVLGLIDEDWRRRLDHDHWSLLKGEREVAKGASESAITPFAIDVRPGRRWVAHAAAPRLSSARFNYGLGAALNAGVLALGLWPRRWDIDTVVSQKSVRAWIKENPRVSKFRRTVKRSNVGRDIDDDRAAMRELRAYRMTEELAPERNGTLKFVDPDGSLNEYIEAKLVGLGTGDLAVFIVSRGSAGRERRYNSRQQSDETYVTAFGDNFEQGIEAVLEAVRRYSEEREGDSSPFVDDADDLDGPEEGPLEEE